MKSKTIELLNKYTPLPRVISQQIVNEYLYDHNQTTFLQRLLKSKLNSQHRCTQIFIASYAILSMFVHLFCLVLIAWINTEWSTQNDIYGKHAFFFFKHASFASWVITVFTYHPMFKFINYAFSIHILYADQDPQNDYSYLLGCNNRLSVNNRDKDLFKSHDTKQYYVTIIGLPYLLVFLSCIVPSIFVYLIPAMAYYFPVTLCACCVAGGVSVLLMNLDGVSIDIVQYDQVYKNIKLYILMAIPLYLVFLVAISAIECNYSRYLNRKGFDGWDKYGICLYESVIYTQGYCSAFTIDWSDWRSIVLFASWILF